MIVRTYNTFEVAARDLWAAETTAGRLFAATGIRVVWINCATGGRRHAELSPRCDQPVDGAEVILRIVAAGQQDRSANVSMGFSLVNSHHTQAGVMATVFPDRVRDTARAAGMTNACCLAW